MSPCNQDVWLFWHCLICWWKAFHFYLQAASLVWRSLFWFPLFSGVGFYGFFWWWGGDPLESPRSWLVSLLATWHLSSFTTDMFLLSVTSVQHGADYVMPVHAGGSFSPHICFSVSGYRSASDFSLLGACSRFFFSCIPNVGTCTHSCG